jgi:hypothetical protein
MKKKLIYICFCLAIPLLVGCSSSGFSVFSDKSSNFDESNQMNADLLGDMPLPNGAKILPQNSINIGKGVGWVGRVNVAALQNSNDIYSFFLTDIPKSGWTILSSTKSKTSVIFAIKGDRTCTIEISEGSLTGPKTLISIISSPKNSPISIK